MIKRDNTGCLISEQERDFITNREYNLAYEQFIAEGRSKQYAKSAARLHALQFLDNYIASYEAAVIRDIKCLLDDNYSIPEIINKLNVDEALIKEIQEKGNVV